jgi:L-ascorbate metabolism protein UlaG (beta-lactamase superfamily)
LLELVDDYYALVAILEEAEAEYTTMMTMAELEALVEALNE